MKLYIARVRSVFESGFTAKAMAMAMAMQSNFYNQDAYKTRL
jgi:hypothetical protein